MTEKAIVKKIEGDLLQVAFSEECQSCEKCGSCLDTSKPRLFTVRNPRALRVALGDRIEYSIDPGKAIKAAFLLLILPIALFFPFYYGAAAMLPRAGEAPAVVIGLAGLALGFGVNLLLRRGRRDYPELLRVLGAGPDPLP